MNIVDVIKSSLSGPAMGRLGSLIGASPEQTKAVAFAAVPAMLAGMGKLSSTTEGADRLSDILSKLDPSMVDKMGGTFTDDHASQMETQGGGMLDSVLGGGGILDALGGLLSKFTGVSLESIKKLLRFLAPLILGLIAKHLSGKPTGSSLTQFFSEQKRHIADAFPPGFPLGSLPGFEGIAGWVKDGVSQLTWLLPILLVALALALWFYFKPPDNAVKGPVITSVKEISKSLFPSMDGQVNDFFSTATNTFNGIKDAAAVEVALPRIKELDDKLDALKRNFDRVPADTRNAVKPLMSDGMARLKALVEKVLAIPGVSDKLKPVVEPLLAKLAAIAG
jgi:hypothetical protein